MSQHRVFSFRSSEKLLAKAMKLDIAIPFQKDLSPLFEDIHLASKKLSNRLAVQPMEGCDANADGSPSDLTLRRYKRFARGGSALIWFEATSVAPDGRSNPRQLWLHRKSVPGFIKLVEETREEAVRSLGAGHDIYCVLQLTHSGRYSRPEGEPRPKVAVINPFLDDQRKNLQVFSDEELDRLREDFVDAAVLAERAGFDAVDIKACHGYVINELLGAFQRQNSKYGGSFENRVRFLKEIVVEIHREVSRIGLAVRMSVHDGMPFPYGFGSPEDGAPVVDLKEPKRVMASLIEENCSLFNITAGVPSIFPHLGRPFDRPVRGAPIPPEHPLEGVFRLIRMTAEMQNEFPDVPLVGSGYSWLRQYFPYVGAAVLQNREAAFIGLGRSAFAYPDAPNDLQNKGMLDPKKVCVSCSRCTEMMRMGGNAGCVMRDKEIYGKKYRVLLKERIRDEKKLDRR